MTSAEKKSFTSNKLTFLDAMSKDTRLTANAFRVAFRLLQHFSNDAGAAFPAQATLASEVGCSIRSIKDAIADLVESGWIEIVRNGKRNFYVFRWPKPDGNGGPPMTPTKRQKRNAQAANRHMQKSAKTGNRHMQKSVSGGNRHMQKSVSAYRLTPTYPSGVNTYDPPEVNTYDHIRAKSAPADRVGPGGKVQGGKGTTKNTTTGFRDIMRGIGMSESTIGNLCAYLRSVSRRLTPGLGGRLRNDLLMMRDDHGISFESTIATMVDLGWDVIADPDRLAAEAADISEAA
jgi:hypothetical protein